MTRIESMRRRVLAGAALLGMAAPPAMAQTLPSCSETVTLGASEYTAWLSPDDQGARARMHVTLAPSRTRLAPGLRFSGDERPTLTVAVFEGQLQDGSGTPGQPAFTLRMPFLTRGGDSADGGVLSGTLIVNGERLTGTFEEGYLEYEAQMFATRPATLRGVRGDIAAEYRIDGVPAAALTFPTRPLSQAVEAYGRMDRALRAKHEAGECEIPTGCFLTTAACEMVGLADDCWELRTLRRFRDGWLAKQADGGADIARYYAEAPAIADRLRQDPRAALRLYWTRIVPSALAAQLGLNRAARALYSRGMRELLAA